MGLGKKRVLAALWAALLIAASGCKPHPDMTEAPAVPVASGAMTADHRADAGADSRAGGAAAALKPGQFLDGGGAAVDPIWVGAQAAKSAYVLIGEGHPIACDHQVQARFLELMVAEGSPPAVGLEMVSLDDQPVLDLFNKGYLGVDDMEAALKWDRTWGFPFKYYRPVFEVAHAHGLPLYALNAPREAVGKAVKLGLKGLSIQERMGLPGKIIDVPKEQEAFLREVFEAHHFKASTNAHSIKASKGREDAWKRFLATQALWDTTMAHRALEARVTTRRPVVILAGGGHVERGWGIASRLAVLDPQGTRLLVMPWRGGQTLDPVDADVFFFCPVAGRSRLGLTFEVKEGRVTVTAVVPNSPAEAAGIVPGDLISKAQGMPVHALEDLHAAAMKAVGAGEAGPLRLEIIRAGQARQIDVHLMPAGNPLTPTP